MPKTATPPSDAPRLLTMADLAAQFALPESTARYYCRRFNAFLPQAGKGRRKYTPEAVAVFAAITEAMRRTRHARSVEMELSLQFPATAPVPADAAGDAALAVVEYNPVSALHEFSRGILQILNAQAQALERIADALAGMSHIAPAGEQAPRARAAAPAGPQNAPAVDADIENLRKEIKTLRGLMSSSEQIHQQDVEQLRKWLNRLAAVQDGQNSGGA